MYTYIFISIIFLVSNYKQPVTVKVCEIKIIIIIFNFFLDMAIDYYYYYIFISFTLT